MNTLLYEPPIPLLNMHTLKLITYVNPNICKHFIAILPVITQTGNSEIPINNRKDKV